MGKYAFFAILILCMPFSSNAEIVEGIAAVVNERVITLTDLEEELAISRIRGEKIDRSAALDRLVEGELTAMEALRLGIGVSMEEVTEELLRFEEGFSSKAEFLEFQKKYDLDLKSLSRKFVASISREKVKLRKEEVFSGRYEKWLSEAAKKNEIRVLER